MQLPGSTEQTLAPELSRSEKLLWSGRPRQGVFLSPKDAVLIPFSLLWGGFAIFWEYSVVISNAPVFFDLWGVPFVLVGLYLIFGRFLYDAKQRSRTYYGLTNQRVIIVSGVFSRTVTSLQLRTLSDLSLTERAGGIGTITFGPPPPWWSGYGGWPTARKTMVPAFDSIADARAVFDRIRLAQQET